MMKAPMESTRINRVAAALFAVTATVALSACAGPKPNPALDDARSVFQRANTDPAVARSSPQELESAQKALREAEHAYEEGEATQRVNHLAYLARSRSEVAVETSRAQALEQRVGEAGRERERLAAEAQARRAQADAEQARQRNQDLARQLRELRARDTDRGMVLTLGDVLFDTGRAGLKPAALSSLSRLARFMRENPGRKISVEGHTDSTGGASLNQSLSERRAESVKSALVTNYGVDPGRIMTSGVGDAMPVASNKTAAGRQQNRRVEIVISDDSGSIPPQRR